MIYYAIGDIHGEYDMMDKLMGCIMEDVRTLDQEWRIITLGDYVDRGPKSAQVVAYLRKSQEDLDAMSARPHKMICLLGNHEQLMIDAIKQGDRVSVHNWLINGGEATMQSYGVETQFQIPRGDVDWMMSLPYVHRNEDAKIMFVHAGVLPSQFPNLPKETAIWSRYQAFFQDFAWHTWGTGIEDWLIVHGHTPSPLEVSEHRINCDTGACFGADIPIILGTSQRDYGFGCLTCAKINSVTREVTIFQVNKALQLTKIDDANLDKGKRYHP